MALWSFEPTPHRIATRPARIETPAQALLVALHGLSATAQAIVDRAKFARNAACIRALADLWRGRVRLSATGKRDRRVGDRKP